ncbi:MAG: hypothetical protein ACQEQN_06325, partial [Thermodesulfobacteriota bacterium]
CVWRAIKTNAGCFASLRQERSTITPNVAHGEQPPPQMKLVYLYIASLTVSLLASCFKSWKSLLFEFRFFEIGMAIERKEQVTCTKRFVVTVFQKEDVVFCGFEKTDFDSDFNFDNMPHIKWPISL